MSNPIRDHRVEAFCDWLESGPMNVPFKQRTGFRMLFGDLTSAEFEAAGTEMGRRAQALKLEIQRREGKRNG